MQQVWKNNWNRPLLCARNGPLGRWPSSHAIQEADAMCMLSRVRLFMTPVDCRLPGSSVHGILWARILGWQLGCMRQVLRAGALGRPRGMGWGGRREGGSGWATHVNPWLIHVNVWQKPLQYCKVISLQLIKINGKKIIKCCKPMS